MSTGHEKDLPNGFRRSIDGVHQFLQLSVGIWTYYGLKCMFGSEDLFFIRLVLGMCVHHKTKSQPVCVEILIFFYVY